MSKRALFLAILTVVAAIVVLVFFKPGFAPVRRPLKRDAQIKLARPAGQCVKTSSEFDVFLRGSRKEQSQFTWHITNGCDPGATVCVTDFTHETDGRISPFAEERYCNVPGGPDANRITASVRSTAPEGIYDYSVYLGATKIDPMIDIVP
jgi:hypothetical protein